MKILIVVIIILAIILLAQLLKVDQLSAKLRNNDEAEVTEDESKFNAFMLIAFMVVFMVSSVWLMIEYGGGIATGPSGSSHGEEIDWLYNFNWAILLFVFFITQPVLFIFAAKYRAKKGVKAVFFSHSNKLELIWTVIPAAVLAFVIIFGLMIWNDITSDKTFYVNPTAQYTIDNVETYDNISQAKDAHPNESQFFSVDGKLVLFNDYVSLRKYFDNEEDAKAFTVETSEYQKDIQETQVIELYSYQFGWWARYSGVDNKLGKSDYKVLDEGANPMAVLTTDVIKAKQEAWSSQIKDIEKELEDTELMNDAKIAELEAKKSLLTRQLKRLGPLLEAQTEEEDAAALNDVLVKEMVLIKGQNYEFKFRSRDVIHSAYFPHFRAQMNCVPGMTSRFVFTPIRTTKEMRNDPEISMQYKRINDIRAEKNEPAVAFDYTLLCNKICGASHYNMQLKITVVETKAEYDAWFKEQEAKKSFGVLSGAVEVKEDDKSEGNDEAVDAEIIDGEEDSNEVAQVQ